jgi:hypothetical protein
MRGVENLFHFYVKASIHVALAVVSLVYLSLEFLNIPPEINLFFFLFFGTIPAYNLIKQLTEGKNHFFGLASINRMTLWISCISLILALFFGIRLQWDTWEGIFSLTLLAAIYALPILPRRRNLRHWGLLKIFSIGLVWSGATVLLPVLESRILFDWDVWVELAQRFMIILVLMVPFEIRDLHVDPPAMLTVPQRFGLAKTRIYGVLICFLFLFTTFLKDDLTEMEIFAKTLIFFSLMGLLLLMPKRQSRYFAAFWVEGFPVLWAILFWLVSNLL